LIKCWQHGVQINGKNGHKKEEGMNTKKVILVMLVLMISLIFITSCGGSDAKVVRQIPSGFILLPKGGGDWDNGLHYVSWESQISFLDSDENCIYQTGFDNRDFIVKYKNEYYVNEDKILELIDSANSSFEQQK
jgi:hypothetical protein